MNGSELRAIRRLLDWTQRRLAAAMGVAPNTVARWERDELPIRDSMAKLARSVVFEAIQTGNAESGPDLRKPAADRKIRVSRGRTSA